MKILELEVVSSSVMRMLSSTCQEMESVASRWAKKRATFRSLLVSSRCTNAYCLRKHSSKRACQVWWCPQ